MNQNELAAAAAGPSYGRLESDSVSDSEGKPGSKPGGEPGGEIRWVLDPLLELPWHLVHSDWSPPSEQHFVTYSELFSAEVLVESEED